MRLAGSEALRKFKAFRRRNDFYGIAMGWPFGRGGLENWEDSLKHVEIGCFEGLSDVFIRFLGINLTNTWKAAYGNFRPTSSILRFHKNQTGSPY